MVKARKFILASHAVTKYAILPAGALDNSIYTCIMFLFCFQPFIDVLLPQGLKPHQLRPQDMHELTSRAYGNIPLVHNMYDNEALKVDFEKNT